eukprot:CAMPEP_0178433586 /NCGR_PEP_ID=MMETSP0689_2-20121128/32982_1 /TAXON_ID=160604 /ORGANISM="Amphidinium massartii, Strain CS-259" /LENGTH=75 /DNA_ID=CAMNT_0020055619 /DNA_START=36 /DNA_END=260 /DNA_ORIENTATION=-
MAQRSKVLSLALLVAATWVAGLTFLPSPSTAQRPAGLEVSPAVAGATVPLAMMQPAFADDENFPAWPYMVAFIGV